MRLNGKVNATVCPVTTKVPDVVLTTRQAFIVKDMADLVNNESSRSNAVRGLQKLRRTRLIICS